MKNTIITAMVTLALVVPSTTALAYGYNGSGYGSMVYGHGNSNFNKVNYGYTGQGSKSKPAVKKDSYKIVRPYSNFYSNSYSNYGLSNYNSYGNYRGY